MIKASYRIDSLENLKTLPVTTSDVSYRIDSLEKEEWDAAVSYRIDSLEMKIAIGVIRLTVSYRKRPLNPMPIF